MARLTPDQVEAIRERIQNAAHRHDIESLLAHIEAMEEELAEARVSSVAMVNLLGWWLRWEAERGPDDPVGATVTYLAGKNSDGT